MKPKREKREWVRHSVHCRCDVALEALTDRLRDIPAPPDVNRSTSQERINYCISMRVWLDGTDAVLAKYGKSSGDTGKKGESRTGRRHTRRSSVAAPKDSTAPEPRRPERKRQSHQASPPDVPMQPRLGAPETEPGANQITQELRSAEFAHWNMRTDGAWEG